MSDKTKPGVAANDASAPPPPAMQLDAGDPEIAALLDFEPVPRKRVVDAGWTAELQREFIARLAAHGSPGRACEEMGKALTGMTKLYRSPLAASFRAAWDKAVALAKTRREESAAHDYVQPGARPPGVDLRRRQEAVDAPVPGQLASAGPLPGQVLNEYGEWEDADSLARRGEDAMESIRQKLLRCRRAFLAEICGCPGKRAAFEILTELPIDWERAARLEPQEDEPYKSRNQREPDMVLTAESGWSFGDIGYGPNRMEAARNAIDEWRAAGGMPPVEWDQEPEDVTVAPPPPMGEDGRG